MSDASRPGGAVPARLVDRAAGLLARGTAGARPVLGIAGPPGAGKTTLAVGLVAELRSIGVPARHVPMDGFHLADVALERLGLRGTKGAPATFDAHGYAALLARVAARPDHVVHAPAFERDLEQPLAGAIGVEPDDELVVTEGNYLLLDEPGWRDARQHLAEVWFCELDARTRTSRLVARHVASGKGRSEAAAFVAQVDEPNAQLVGTTRGRADLVVPVA